ncbi:MAG: exopolysaccharide Pel transporter PelG [Eubacteriales bacterium]|nr:exopolysaccharide Pel transporter PelG [Eubacteriales bacterium]MDD4476053.1 exopolysaccharide Pel transporter PelG [Eubacteriales bacterium]
MAGIGFELKKLFSKRGLMATVRAYGYAGIVTTGPMLLGVVLLLGLTLIMYYGNAMQNDRELLLSMVTYALLTSLTVTSFYTMITTRYTADMLYSDTRHAIMPSFFGSLGMMLVTGGTAYGIFLYFSGVQFSYQVLSWFLFLVLIVTWTETTYLTAVKDYRSILIAFVVSLIIVFALGFTLVAFTDMNPVNALMIAVIVGYSVLATWYFCLIYKYFPEGFGSSSTFLRWVEKYPSLVFVGAFVTIGLFGHLVIMWTSPLGVQVRGLFYGAPQYDVPALFAFFSILVTTVNFVTSVEVRFYPRYKSYYALFNERGSINDIDTAENSMLKVLRDELSYLGQKQLFSTILFIVIGTIIIQHFNLGFTEDMLGIYRVLCVGYAFYAIGNSTMLILLYFSDNKGALMSSAFFCVFTNVSTWLLKDDYPTFYGFGFVIGGIAFCIVTFWRLAVYVKKLKYHTLSEQPIFARAKEGFISGMCEVLEARAARIQKSRRKYYDDKMEEIENKNINSEAEHEQKI